MANDATFYQNAAQKRAGEVTTADWDNGMNRGGSNAPGVGIATDNPNLEQSLPSWTLEDQHEAARTPQDGQHLGEGGGTLGNEGVGTVPINIADAEGDDFNDTASLADLAVGWARNTVA